MKLKEIREENNLTQKDIAIILKVSRGTYGMWEIEHNPFPLNRLNDFCNYFDVSIDYVLELTDLKQYPDNRKEINIKLSAERLKKIRKKNKKTQDYLAKKFNLNQVSLSNYENGVYLILTAILLEYSKYFNVSTDYLLGKKDSKIIIKLKKKIKQVN